MKAVFLDYATLGADNLDPTPLYDVVPELELYPETDDADVAGRIRDAGFVFVNKVALRERHLVTAKDLRYIGVAATGTDNVDTESAARQRIAVTNIRGYCTQSVAEHVIGILLTLTHNLHRYRADVRRGEWQKAGNFCLFGHPLRELSAMTLGIVGYGELGRGVARAAQSFGMDVLVSRRIGSDSTHADGRHDFRDIVTLSDVLSLHCPLTEATRGLIGAAELEAMKSDAILINTARGALVDSAALVEALENDRIGGAAIDVLAQEPPVDGDPLLGYDGDNLILTPHIAWATEEARQNAIVEMAANVRAFQAGQERFRVA